MTSPINMILHCPNCGLQHIDEPSDDAYEGNPPTWTNPPHRSHLCHGCGHIWRPADVPTNGVECITTKGKNDSPLPWEPPMTEEQGYVIEAVWQFVPELKAREDHLIVLTPAQLETVLRRLGWHAPCDARKGVLPTATRPAIPLEAIGKLVNAAMEQAVANGANSVSMPDEIVEAAQWLADMPKEVK